MQLSDFDYTLPKELIANAPMDKRDESRLMVLQGKEISHKQFKDVVDYFSKGDIIVINETKVEPVKLVGNKKSGSHAEFLIAKKIESNVYECKIKSNNVKEGTEFVFDKEVEAKVISKSAEGDYTVEFNTDNLEKVLQEIGEMPLPPYIKSQESPEVVKKKYQTVYAKTSGSIAAPTAGFHFTPELMTALEKKGVEFVKITLHVGYGTFLPVHTDDIKEHKMHAEWFEITPEAADAINNRRGKLAVVGTTSLRALESATDNMGLVGAMHGYTDIYIYPGYKFKLKVDMMITNFHLPKSTLIMLVGALAGLDNIMNAYKIAVSEKYRFYSFGDAMLLVP